MRRLKKAVSLAVVTAIVAASLDMGSVMAVESSTVSNAEVVECEVIQDEESDFRIEDGILVEYLGSEGDVVIPDGVTAIGRGAFAGDSSLSSIKIPDSVTTIGERAFCGCLNLNCVEIPNSVTKIGREAFRGCDSLIDIELPLGINKIESNTFDGCENLSSIEIPENVTEIGHFAFMDCSNLSSIEIPESVTDIGENTFEGCRGLTIYCEENSYVETYAKAYGISYQDINNIIQPTTPTATEIRPTTPTATEIRPTTPTARPMTATPSAVPSLTTVPTRAMTATPSAVPSLTTAPTRAMTATPSTVPSLTPTPTRAMTATPSTVPSLTPTPIKPVTAMPTPTLTPEATATPVPSPIPEEFEIVEGVLVDYHGKDIDVLIPEGVKKIGYGAFFNCTNLISVKLPEGVTSIGKSAFSGCENLNSVELPKGLKSIRGYAFSGCSSLNSINIPEGVTNIGCYAFSKCSSLTSIKIPEGVTRIGWSAFENCNNLSEAQLPESLCVVGKNIFYNCDKLTNKEIADEVVDTELHRVYTEADLQQMMNYPQGTFELMNDIVLSESWDTIEEFSGVLDGNGYTISNVDTTLFANLTKVSIIKNLNISGNINITKRGEESTFLATNVYGIVENCVVKGKIEQTRGIGWSMAGFASVNNGIIRGCRNEADIIQTVNGGDGFDSVAGIVKENYGTIDNCENIGNIKSGSRFTGGIAGGRLFSNIRDNGQIINCTNKGDIYSNYKNQDEYNRYTPLVGGIIAENQSLVYGCINEGSVSADDSEKQAVGGIAGEASGYSYFIRCKNTGNVKGGICAYAEITSGGFDENDKFYARHGNIIIAECENNIRQIENTENYYICKMAESMNGEIRITRCKNIIGGKPRGTYCGNTFVGAKGSVVVEDNGKTDWKEAVNGEMIVMNEKEKRDLGLLSKEGISGMFVDNPGIGYVGNDGIYTAKMAGNGTLYYIYTDGSVELHDFVVKEVVITPTPILTPLVTVTLKPVATVTVIPPATTSEVPLATPTELPPAIPTELPSVTPTTVPSVIPTKLPTVAPTKLPSVIPTVVPSVRPEATPTPVPSVKPSATVVPSITPLVTLITAPSKVPQKPQNITAKSITKTYGDKAFNIGAKTDGKGNLNYISDNKKVATVSENGKVTIKGCGKATITIKVSETEEYKASEKKITITVKPKKQKVTSLKSTKAKTINVKWRKDVKASGYILQYSTSKNFKKNVKSITVSGNKTTSKKISKLKAGKKYYVRVCSYKKVSGEKVKGSYSTVKSVKVKN